MTVRIFTILVIVLIGAFIDSPTPSYAGTQQVKGTLNSLDLETGTITLQFGTGKFLQKETYSLSAPNLPVIASTGKKTDVKALRPGLMVTLQLSDVGDVEAIVAKAPVRSGIFVAYHPDKQMLILEDKKGESEQLHVAKDTSVTINRTEADLTHLRYHHRLMMVMSIDGKQVLSMVARLSREPKDPRGTIVNVDVANSTITILEGMNGKNRFVTLPVSKDFILVFETEQVKGATLETLPVITELKNLHRGLPTWVRLSKEKQVEAVVVVPASIPAHIVNVDPNKHTVEVKYDNGETETFRVNDDADVRVDIRRTSLDAVRPGMTAELHLSYQPGRLVGMKCKTP